MTIELFVELANIWVDPTFFCLYEFKYDDKLELLSAYLIMVIIQLLFIMTWESLIFMKHQDKIEKQQDLDAKLKQHERASKYIFNAICIFDILLLAALYLMEKKYY